MNRSERRHEDQKAKARVVRKALTTTSMTRDEITPKWVGITAAMHFTCACWMCTTPELKHRRPAAPSVDPEQDQDWLKERRCDFITGDAQVHQISPGQQP